MGEKIVLIDGYSLLYRAFFALPLMDNGEGEYTNAVFGFMSMLLKVIESEQPEYIAVAFDTDKHTFRHEKCAYYKANRAPTPDEMRCQVESVKSLLSAMNISTLQKQGYEADDILGTVSLLCAQGGVKAVIVTGDRDSYQLVTDDISVLYTKKGISETEVINPEWVKNKYGLEPGQLIDVKSLMGDTSDNIPGVSGIGEKTAVKLISEFGSLENVLNNIETGLKGAVKEKILAGRENALESRFLAEIDRNVPIQFDLEACGKFNPAGGLDILRRLKLKSIIERLGNAKTASEPQKTISKIKFEPVKTVSIDTLANEISLAAAGSKFMAVHMAEMLSVAFDTGKSINVAVGGDLLSPGLSGEDVYGAIKPVIAQNGITLIAHNTKDFPCVLTEGEFEDVMLAAYALNPQKACKTIEDVCAGLDISVTEGQEAQAALECWFELKERLNKDGLYALYSDVEKPLSLVLKAMENTGFRVDTEYLKQLGNIYVERINDLTEQIYALAGRQVNINSPKQLKQLLFEELKLPVPGGKKTAGSTAADVLEELAEDYPICALILEYRKYQKLNSTYVQGLVNQRESDGRIHTCFEQAVTGTGRISSREPNLQNIPVRTALGREIRRAFIPKDGYVLVDADYSQIELRVLAHMSGDESLKDAFIKKQDVHTRTAAEIFSVDIGEVTPELRSKAKAVNFGIVYGISEFGLAKNTGVSVKQAGDFIKRYFEKYPGVKRFTDGLVSEGKANGYVKTILGRRRYLPELASSSYQMRAFGERAAMNSPVQGSAADIIKLAMVNVYNELKRRGLKSKLIMQVHDELILECPADEADLAGKLLTECMENVLKLSVPLVSEVGSGGNWNECKP